MIIADDTIERAFSEHHRRYRSRPDWSIEYHTECWQDAVRARESCSLADYKVVYGHLKNKWRAFRPVTPGQWGAEKILAELVLLNGSQFKTWSLSSLGEDDSDSLLEIFRKMGQMKLNKSGPSVVALSKVLHFWNPRLFVIVDDLIMWKWVFAHSWLKGPIDKIGAKFREPSRKRGTPDDRACDLISYLAILLWTADLVRQNPSLTPAFANYVRTRCSDIGSIPLEEYEAAAVEWFLLGVVDLRPPGID